MKKWSFSELSSYIHEDIDEFMSDGLDIRQATSRVQVEYDAAIKSSNLDKLVIYMALCEEGLKHGFLRDDIKSDTLSLLECADSIEMDTSLSANEIRELRRQIVRIKSSFLGQS